MKRRVVKRVAISANFSLAASSKTDKFSFDGNVGAGILYVENDECWGKVQEVSDSINSQFIFSSDINAIIHFMFKSSILLFISLCCCSIVQGQNSGTRLYSKAELPKPITPSPEAAALGKYGEIPVSLFSGQVDVSIPIYTFKSGDISVPIKLNYNSGGIRVDDIATNVGLGWSLNAGGVITRTQNGGPDGTNNLEFPERFDPNSAGLGVNSADYVLAKQLIEEHKDFERDIYFYNFLNSAGKFQRDYSGKVCFFPANPNIKVDFYENGAEFIITDDNGLKYFFTALETSKITPVCTIGVPGPYEYPDGTATAYYLTKIVSPNNYRVDFEYESYSYKIIKGYNEVVYQKSSPSDCADLTNQNRTCTMIQEFFGKRIKRITSPDNLNLVEFRYSDASRLDLKYNNQNQGNYLEHIYIKNDVIQVNNWDFTYSYFGSGSNLRLKLLSVKEGGQPAYEFLYNEQHPLPERLSFSQDYWGFYNGKTALNTFIPPVPILGRISGADRTPDFEYMRSYSLESIKYPTGGNTNFEYEPHQDYVTENTTSYVTESIALSNTSNGTSDFFLPENVAELRLVWNLPVTYIDDFLHGYIYGGANLSTVLKTVSGDGFTSALSSIVPNATYRLAISGNNTNDQGHLSLEWKKPITTTSSYNKIVFGGLRIKSVNSYDVGQIIKSRYYNYNWVNNTLRSSVILPESAYDLLTFYSFYMFPKINTSGSGAILEGTCGYNVFSSNSSQSLGAGMDTGIGYAEVTEMSDEDATNGRTIYRYLTSGIDGAKGALLKKTIQRKENGIFRNVSHLSNIYQTPLSSQDTIPSMRINYSMPEAIVGSGEHFFSVAAQFEVQKRLAISGRFQLQETREVSYNLMATDSVEIKTNYEYSNLLHTYPTAIEKKNSRGKIIRVEKKYILDMLSYGVLYNILKDANIIAPIIEENSRNSTDDIQLEYKKTNYGNFESLIKPISIETSIGGSPVSTEVIFNSYDSHGRLLRFSQPGAVPTSYRWSTLHEYAIAQCQNATEFEFYSQDFEEDLTATIATSVLPAHTGKRYHTGSYIVNWIVPNSRTYLISYRYRSLGVWKLKDNQAYVNGFTLSGGDAYDDIRVHPKDAQLTTYTYKPLFGMSSQTDARLITIHYVYDSFGRLLHVKDHVGNIIKSNNYYFKN